ncbi:MAG: toll/interleukin-1 receptor domain-containing protein [Hyphomonadaceae bacterium]|nr:toll/interleukin-1 receptor domain-containing protein [Hyphomonadaceae bacterium]
MRPAGGSGTAKNLADVFISCSRLDRGRVQPIAERLSSLGYSVWWDARAGQASASEIERQFSEARAVVTVWSDHARNSSVVLAQSAAALDENRLLQMQIDTGRPPAPFDTLKVAEIHSGKSEWGVLEASLAALVREKRPPEVIDHRAASGARPTIAGAPRLLLVAGATALVAFAGALSAGFNGVMRPDQMQIALLGVMAVGGLCAAAAAQRLLSIRRAGG